MSKELKDSGPDARAFQFQDQIMQASMDLENEGVGHLELAMVLMSGGELHAALSNDPDVIVFLDYTIKNFKKLLKAKKAQFKEDK